MKGNWKSSVVMIFGSLAFTKRHCHLKSSLPSLKLHDLKANCLVELKSNL